MEDTFSSDWVGAVSCDKKIKSYKYSKNSLFVGFLSIQVLLKIISRIVLFSEVQIALTVLRMFFSTQDQLVS